MSFSNTTSRGKNLETGDLSVPWAAQDDLGLLFHLIRIQILTLTKLDIKSHQKVPDLVLFLDFGLGTEKLKLTFVTCLIFKLSYLLPWRRLPLTELGAWLRKPRL